MNTKDQIDRNIFEDMKECVRRAGLPVFLDPCLCDGNQNKFTSKIGQGSSTVHFRGSYDNLHRYAKVIFESEDRIDTKDTGVARQMINAMNAHMPFFHYSLCPDCNGIEVHASLYVPTKGFPRKKFKKLFNVLLKEIMTVLPLMIKIIRKGGTFDDLKEVLQGKHSDSTAETFNQTDGGENEEETVR